MSKKKERGLDDLLLAAGVLHSAGLPAEDTRSALLDVRYASYDDGIDESYLDYLKY